MKHPPMDFYYLLKQRGLATVEDCAIIDQIIWQTFGQEQAVMFTDLCGFSKLSAEQGILAALAQVALAQSICAPIWQQYNGRLLKTEGDSFLVAFNFALDAANAAIKMQLALQAYNCAQLNAPKLAIGLGFGRVLCVGNTEIFGDEVNRASKLGEDYGCAGEILCTEQFALACRDHYFNFLPRPSVNDRTVKLIISDFITA